MYAFSISIHITTLYKNHYLHILFVDIEGMVFFQLSVIISVFLFNYCNGVSMRNVTTTVAQRVEEILACYHHDDIHLTEILHSIQDEFHYIPKEVLPIVAQRLETAESIVMGVVNFYSEFVLEPQGKYIIKVCEGSSCVTAGAENVTATIMREITKLNKDFSSLPLFALEKVVCLGKCNSAPNVLINGTFYTNVTADKISKVLETIALDEKKLQKAS